MPGTKIVPTWQGFKGIQTGTKCYVRLHATDWLVSAVISFDES